MPIPQLMDPSDTLSVIRRAQEKAASLPSGPEKEAIICLCAVADFLQMQISEQAQEIERLKGEQSPKPR